VAVNVTLAPVQTVVPWLELTDTVAGMLLLTVITRILEVSGFPDMQEALEVIIHFTESPLFSELLV
jgi:hypothetical protein